LIVISFILGESVPTTPDRSKNDLGGRSAWEDGKNGGNGNGGGNGGDNGGNGGGGTHAPTLLSGISGKQHRNPNKKFDDYNVDLTMKDRFTQRVMIKARSEVALTESYAAIDEQAETFERGISLPTIGGNRSPAGSRRGGRSPAGSRNNGNNGNNGGGNNDQGRRHTRNNAKRSSRLGYNKSSMLQRLELVGDIAAEEVSPSKMARRRRVRGSNEVVDVLVPSDSAVEIETNFQEEQLQDQIQQQKTYRELAKRRRKGGGSGKQNLRSMYGL